MRRGRTSTCVTSPKPMEDAADERQIFMPYFLFQWNPDGRRTTARGQGGVVARWYMLEKSKQLTAMERMFLEQATTQPLSFYEVVWNEPGERLAVWDVLIGGETEVIERSGSRTLAAGRPAFCADLAPAGTCRVRQFGAPLHSAGQEDRGHRTPKKTEEENRETESRSGAARSVAICRSDSRHLPGHSRPLLAPPVLRNTDGDPLLFHTLTFLVESAEAAFDALAPLAVGRSREELLDDAELGDDGKLRQVDIDWIKEGNRKFKTWDNTILGHIKISEGRVIAEVNSENRAKRLRKEIEKRLGVLAVHESTRAQTLDEMRNNAPTRGRGCGTAQARDGSDVARSGSEKAAASRDAEASRKLDSSKDSGIRRAHAHAGRSRSRRQGNGRSTASRLGAPR